LDNKLGQVTLAGAAQSGAVSAEALAVALLALSLDDRKRLAALLLVQPLDQAKG
jgi:hypothetical protein